MIWAPSRSWRIWLDHAGPAVNRGHPNFGQVAGISFQISGDLQAQLPGGAQDHALGTGQGRIDPLEQRQSESGGLSGAGLGQADKVPPSVEQFGQGRRLNRHRCFESQIINGPQQFSTQADIPKIHLSFSFYAA
jgi:hypothetical protein